METLAGKKIVVVGGAGLVGEGVVRQLLHHGAQVWVPSRSRQKLDELVRLLGNPAGLETSVADVSSAAGAEEMVHEAEEEFGPVDAVVASLGGGWSLAPLLEQTEEDWRAVMSSSLDAHFYVAQAFLHRMADRPLSSYIFINGAAMREPSRRIVPMNVTAVAQSMLARGFALELRSEPIRIHSLVLGTPIITRDRESGPENWLTADECGAYVSYLVSNLGIAQEEEVVIDFDRREQLGLLGISVLS